MRSGSLRIAGVVYRKELRETLRDRRTLIVMVLLPIVLYPLVGIGVTQWVGIQRSTQKERPSAIALVGPGWPTLEAALRAEARLALRALNPGARPADAVRRAQVDAVLVVPAEVATGQDSGTVVLQLLHDETRDASTLARSRIRAALNKLSDLLIKDRLARHHLPPLLAEPLRLDDHGVATPRAVGGHVLSSTLPLLVVLMVLLGAFYPAIDLTAGEKERGTLETLLTAPVPRNSLVLGKCLVVATIAFITGLLNLASLGLTLAIGLRPALKTAGVVSQLPWGAVALSVVALAPTALFFAGLMIAVAALARSFKEAQTLLTPVYVVCVVPAALAQLPGTQLTPLTALVPPLNIALLTRDLIGGQVALPTLIIVLLSTCAAALGAVFFAARIYHSERLLFASDPARGSVPTTRPRLGAPTAAQAAGLLALVMALVILVGQPLQVRSLTRGILITEWLLIAAPSLLLLQLGRLAPQPVLSLQRPPITALFGALFAGLSAWYLVGLYVEFVQQQVLPMPRQVLEHAQRVLFDPSRPIALDLFALAVSPAICEELLFRGVILRASLQTLRPAPAIVLNAVLFGLFHLSAYRVVPTAMLGAILALIVVRSGSIWPAMLFHLLNNSAAILIGRLLPQLSTSSGSLRLPPAIGVAAAVVFALGLLLIWRRRR